MQRRDFLRSAGMVAGGLVLPDRVIDRLGPGAQGTQLSPARDWRVFEVTTRVEILNPSGRTRVWLPTPLTTDTFYQRTLGNTFHAEGGDASLNNLAAPGRGA